MVQSKPGKKHTTTAVNKKLVGQSVKRAFTQVRGAVVPPINKLMTFEVDGAISKWWKNESASAKVSFLSALIVGFISHLFVYTGRYYGRDDMGIIKRHIGPVV